MNKIHMKRNILLTVLVVLLSFGIVSCGDSKDEDKTDDKANIKCTISIDCKTLLDTDEELADKVSDDGVILDKKELTLQGGSTVLDALKATEIEYEGGGYVTSINGLNEFDAGKSSGWMYSVNGEYGLKASDEYELKDGDSVEWRYTLKSGTDIR